MKIKYLIIITVVASFLRLWDLNNVPPHLTPDEAALGYNAYSIMKTGRDEYGTLLPVVFKSFGDYKPGFYIYATVPFVALFDLNEWSVRLPSAIAGILAVLLIYPIVARLFNNKKLGLLASLVLALSPWHIHFSRGAWEVNLALTLTLAGVLYFLKSFQNKRYLILSSIFFASTLLTYQGAKMSTVVVIIALVVAFLPQTKKLGVKTIGTAALVGLLVILPVLVGLLQGQGGRLAVFSIFSENINWARGILSRWFNHFSGRFLFFEGDWSNPRHAPPYQGVLLMSDLFTLVLGMYVFAVRKASQSAKIFVILWLIMAPLSAALSKDLVHAVRSYNLVVPLTIVVALGIYKLLELSKIIRYGFLAIFVASFIYFMDAYFVHVPAHQSKLWEYGYKQMVEAVSLIQDDYEQVVVQQSYAQPYIYFLFFQKYDPVKYQQQSNLVAGHSVLDVGLVEQLDNIRFRYVDWSLERGQKGGLIIADSERVPVQDSVDINQFEVLKTINYLNNRDIAFRIIDIKE